MDANKLFHYYIETLGEKGFDPWFPAKKTMPADVIFKVEDVSYFIENIDPENLEHFSMFSGLKCNCNNEIDRIWIMETVSHTNSLSKYVKTLYQSKNNTAYFVVQAILNSVEDFKLNIDKWINAIMDARSSFTTFLNEMTNKYVLSENEEEITLRETGNTHTYTLSNDIYEIIRAIYEKTGIDIEKISESDWEINTHLSQDVKDMMKKRAVEYSMTSWIENDKLYLVVNRKVDKKYYIYSGMTIGGHFFSENAMRAILEKGYKEEKKSK
jgi:hypothetical protein